MCNIQYISIYLYIFYISEYSLHLFTCFNIIFEYLQKCHLFEYLIIFEKLDTPHKI